MQVMAQIVASLAHLLASIQVPVAAFPAGLPASPWFAPLCFAFLVAVMLFFTWCLWGFVGMLFFFCGPRAADRNWGSYDASVQRMVTAAAFRVFFRSWCCFWRPHKSIGEAIAAGVVTLSARSNRGPIRAGSAPRERTAEPHVAPAGRSAIMQRTDFYGLFIPPRVLLIRVVRLALPVVHFFGLCVVIFAFPRPPRYATPPHTHTPTRTKTQYPRSSPSRFGVRNNWARVHCPPPLQWRLHVGRNPAIGACACIQ